MNNDVRHWRWSHEEKIPILRATYNDQTFARHSHDHYVIGLVDHGSCRSWYRGAYWTLPTGTLAVIPPGEVHDGAPIPGTPWVWRAIYPSPELMQKASSEVYRRSEHAASTPFPVTSGKSPVIPTSAKDDQDLVIRFRKLHRELEASEDEFSAECGLLELLTDLMIRHGRGPQELQPTGKEPVAVRTLKDFIHSNATSRLRLSDLAEAVGFSEGHLTRVFTRAVGMPPHAYLTQVRVELAKSMILDRSDLATVAHAVGFSDQSHFTNRFREYVGVTPGEFARGTVTSR